MNDIDTAALLAEANAYAQRRFRAMLEAESYSDPTAPETRAYVEAERICRFILAEAQAEPLALGDHHVGVGR